MEPKKKIIGRVHWINRNKGYGFITSKEIEFEKIYFYWMGLRPDYPFRNVHVGDTVELDAVWDDEQDGWKGINIGKHVVDEKTIKEASVQRIK